MKQNMQTTNDFDLSGALPPMPDDVHQALMETTNKYAIEKKAVSSMLKCFVLVAVLLVCISLVVLKCFVS